MNQKVIQLEAKLFGVYPETLTESDMYNDTPLLNTGSNHNIQLLPTTLLKKRSDSIEQENTSDIEGTSKHNIVVLIIVF